DRKGKLRIQFRQYFQKYIQTACGTSYYQCFTCFHINEFCAKFLPLSGVHSFWKRGRNLTFPLFLMPDIQIAEGCRQKARRLYPAVAGRNKSPHCGKESAEIR